MSSLLPEGGKIMLIFALNSFVIFSLLQGAQDDTLPSRKASTGLASLSTLDPDQCSQPLSEKPEEISLSLVGHNHVPSLSECPSNTTWLPSGLTCQSSPERGPGQVLQLVLTLGLSNLQVVRWGEFLSNTSPISAWALLHLFPTQDPFAQLWESPCWTLGTGLRTTLFSFLLTPVKRTGTSLLDSLDLVLCCLELYSCYRVSLMCRKICLVGPWESVLGVW